MQSIARLLNHASSQNTIDYTGILENDNVPFFMFLEALSNLIFVQTWTPRKVDGHLLPRPLGSLSVAEHPVVCSVADVPPPLFVMDELVLLHCIET